MRTNSFHVFIVNKDTFPVHLKYMFAGTHTNNNPDIFIANSKFENNKSTLSYKAELTVASMIADISRIRIGDKILFYLTSHDGKPGKFFGGFKAKSAAFYSKDEDNYLKNELNKSLQFRVLIEADSVYPEGVTEQDALDNLEGINHPSEMCWSLIYRKLKGNRGCTAINEFEYNSIMNKIKKINNNKKLKTQNVKLIYDTEKTIIKTCKHVCKYKDKNMQSLSNPIKERIIIKKKNKRAHEAHLQANFIQNCDSKPLSELLGLNNDLPLWIGNEVSCGVGMQSIDVMLTQETKKCFYIYIIELKCTKPYKGIISYQLQKYLLWLNHYIAPIYKNKAIVINPIVVADFNNDKGKLNKSKNLKEYISECNNYKLKISKSKNVSINKVANINYSIFNNTIHYENIDNVIYSLK